MEQPCLFEAGVLTVFGLPNQVGQEILHRVDWAGEFGSSLL